MPVFSFFNVLVLIFLKNMKLIIKKTVVIKKGFIYLNKSENSVYSKIYDGYVKSFLDQVLLQYF